MARQKIVIYRRRVNWNNVEDFDCAFLGSMGFSTRMIRERTGLTSSQIAYRLKKAQVRRVDYRNGESDVAQLLLKSYNKATTALVTRHLPRLK